MALDEPNQNDYSLDQDGLTLLIDNDLLTTCGNVTIDFIESGSRPGFSIFPGKPLSSGSSCGGGCSC